MSGLRICFVADGRSPIARNWIAAMIGRGYEIHLLSSYPCDVSGVASLHVLPLAFSGLVRLLRPITATPWTEGRSTLRARATHTSSSGGLRREGEQLQGWADGGASLLRRLAGTDSVASLAFVLRNWLGPLEVRRHVARARALVADIGPDLVHAMRIPFEGMLAAMAVDGAPLVISVWGNDFTLFAARYPLLGWASRRALRRADALHTDCRYDLELAVGLGFDRQKPAVVLPGAGGVDLELFHPGPVAAAVRRRVGVPDSARVVIQPRGLRRYVRNDVFFRAIPAVLRQHPDVVFVCPGMAGSISAERRVRRLGVARAVRLLPVVPRADLADLFRMAAVAVSPSVHDGTPNTLLEAMACGCLPVVGDLPSIREWITSDTNGLLCDPTNPESLAAAIAEGLENARLRREAAARNVKLIGERAQYQVVMGQVDAFYRRIAGGVPRGTLPAGASGAADRGRASIA